MPLTDYTDYDTIRAVVGVAPEELEDTTLALPLYASEVTLALEDLNDTLPTLYAAIKAMDVGDRTAQQARLYELVGVYSAYWVAKVLLYGSLELFAPRTITDGKATQQRVDDPFKDLRASIAASIETWAARIAKCLGLLDPSLVVNTAPARTYITSAGIAIDPVTGV